MDKDIGELLDDQIRALLPELREKAKVKYPSDVEIWTQPDGSFTIAIYAKRPRAFVEPDCYDAKNAEELLVFLMGVYDWYPEGYDEMPTLDQFHRNFEARWEAERLYHSSPEEFYRRLGICVVPGEEE